MADFGTAAPPDLWASALEINLAGPVPASLVTAAGPAHPQPAPGERGPDAVERLDNRHALVAVSPAMREVRRQVEQVAGIDAALLLLGESGTGKELIARMIHKLSSRSARKFLKVDCAALQPEFLESELFGHEAGAFSGARQARAGKFEIGHKGTILLEDIADMPASAQAKLLRVLQDGEFSRLGSAGTIFSNLRVLAAANADLRPTVQNGTLRADLYYRLNVFTIHLPPLRERREDLPYLLNYFMTIWAASYGRPRLPITRRILETTAAYLWPGNVRELENFVKRYLVLGDEKLAVSQLDFQSAESSQPAPKSEGPIRIDSVAKPGSCNLKSLVRDLKQDAERAAIVQALEQSGGNRQDAASLLQISLRALHYKIRAYGIESAFSRRQNWADQRGAPGPRSIASAGAGGPSGPDKASSVARGGAGSVYPFPRGSGGKVIPMDRTPWPPSR